jgi:hypothetical protein
MASDASAVCASHVIVQRLDRNCDIHLAFRSPRYMVRRVSRRVEHYMRPRSIGREQATDTSRASRTRVTSDFDEALPFAIMDATHVPVSATLQTRGLDRSTVMDTFETLDHDIALAKEQTANTQAHTSTRHLQTRRNALVPLCRLPIDILHRVFDFCELSERLFVEENVRGGGHPHRRQSQWVHLINICTHTRAIALATPVLWTWIDLNRTRWTELCLSRAEQCPLRIFYSGDGHWSHPEAAVRRKKLVELLPRALEIDVALAWLRIEETDAIEAVLNSKLPYVRNLAFTYDWLKRGPPLAPAHIISPSFLGGSSSSLLTLKLGKIMLTSGSIQLPRLIRLELGKVIVQQRFQIVLDFLAHAPCLEHVDLGQLSLEAVDKNEHFRPIHLPALHTLAYGAEASWVVPLIHLLPTPSHELSATMIPPLHRDALPVQVIDLRIEAFEQVCGGLLNGAYTASVLSVIFNRESVYRLEIQGPTRFTRRLVFKSHYRRLADMDGVLNIVNCLQVEGVLVVDILLHVASSSAPSLSSVDHFVLDGVQEYDLSPDCGLSIYLRRWLIAQVAAGRRVKLMEFPCQGYFRHGRRADVVTDMTAFAAGLLESELVDAVSVDGQLVHLTRQDVA